MNRLLLILACAAALALSGSVQYISNAFTPTAAGPSYLVNIGYSATDGVFHAALTNHTAGDCLAVVFQGRGNTAPTAISNTQGSTWPTTSTGTTGWQFNSTANTDGFQIWVIAATAYTGTDTVTVTDTSFHGGVAFIEYTGTGRTCALDAFTSPPAGASTFSSPSAGPITLGGGSDIVIGVGRGAQAMSAGTGFTQRSGGAYWGSGSYNIIEDEQTTATSVTCTMTSSTNPWTLECVGIK